MSTTSPQKRRAPAFQSSMMRQTRSMARISDATDFGELPSSTRPFGQRQAPASSSSQQPPVRSPRKAHASRAAQLDSFDPDSPDTSLAACMESPKKGRFDDFEFELESSNPEVPTRRRRIAPPRQSSTSPSADVGLPRSKTSVNLPRSTTSMNNTLRASRKENSPTAHTEERRPGESPIKPQAAPARSSRLHGPTPSARTSSQPVTTSNATAPRAVKPDDDSASESKPIGSARDSSDRLLFGISDVKLGSNAERNPFVDSRDTNSLAMLGESRHSPVKRFQTKSAFIISSPDRPDRKPINLLELKPSPGKAQRGIFRHNSALDDEDDGDDWDASGSNTVDEIRLVKGPAPNKEEGSAKRDQQPSSSGSAASASSSSSSRNQSMPRSTTSLNVKHALSSETSDALASLEASLAKLKAKTRSPPTDMSAMIKKKDDTSSTDSALKRELGNARPFGMTSSRTQIFRNKPIPSSESSFSARSTTAGDQSNDSSVFKRPVGRVSALAKSRESSSEFRASSNSSMVSSKSMMSFGAPRLPGFSELRGRPTSRPVMTSSRTSSLEIASSDSRMDEGEAAAQEEEEARVAEAKRQAELKAAKRRSMTVLSSGMPPPSQRREPEAAKLSTTAGPSRVIGARSSSASHSSSSSSSQTASSSTQPTPTREPTEAELAEARKAAKAARRRSLYTYVPTKREDPEGGDRSIGNVSSGLVVSDASAPVPKKARFLRGLTVLVDVRDQDGEDASACWIDMLKNAGAKVMVRFGERKLTHIVYKSGRPSTLHSYRALEDPKPHVVGIGWVVACLEQGQKADETPYLVEVAKQAIFATRRRSLMAPKQVPSSANIIRELPKEKLKDVEEARKKLLVHAPVVSSPLRRRISSRTILASRLAQTSLDASPTRSDGSAGDSTATREIDDRADDALLEVYRKRVGSVLSPRRSAGLAA